MHCFEVRTANIDYFVGQDPLYDLQDGSSVNLPPPDSGIGAYLAKSWESSIRQALVPVQANASELTQNLIKPFLFQNLICFKNTKILVKVKNK